MPQTTHRNNKVAPLIFLLLVLLILAAVMLLNLPEEKLPEETPAPTTQAQTESATEATEPTLPPPESSPYSMTDFQYDGRYRKCLAAETIPGIDVSSHQQTIDWQAVADSGIEFAIIRVGYRGYESGQLNPDTRMQENYEGAKAAGLKIGAYIFSQAITVEEAIEEAEYILEAIKDWEIDMPVVFDWEHKKQGRTLNLDSRIVTDCAIAFCDIVREAGYEPMVYFNPHHARRFFHLSELEDYPFWLAFYTDRMQYDYLVEMWQYTNTGSVPGIETDVDINIYFVE